MKNMKFCSSQDWKRRHRKWKVIGFLINRQQQSPQNVMEKIFGYVHSKASHHGKVMNKRWKTAEKRIMARCKRGL